MKPEFICSSKLDKTRFAKYLLDALHKIFQPQKLPILQGFTTKIFNDHHWPTPNLLSRRIPCDKAQVVPPTKSTFNTSVIAKMSLLFFGVLLLRLSNCVSFKQSRLEENVRGDLEETLTRVKTWTALTKRWKNLCRDWKEWKTNSKPTLLRWKIFRTS